MPFSVPATRSRLAVILILSCLGLLVASTAATVLAAGESLRRSAVLPSPLREELARAEHANRAIDWLVDSLVEPLLDASTPGEETLRDMYQLLTPPSDDVVMWDQYTTVAELLNAFSLPNMQREQFEQRWQDNVAAADSALLHDNVADAERRARENIAGARWLMQKPTAQEARRGRELLAQAAFLLSRSAKQGEHPALYTAAQQLTGLVRISAATLAIPEARPWVLGKTTDIKQLSAIAGNDALIPAMRIASLTTVIAGACLDQREVLFGPSDQRLRALIAIGDSLRDIPRVDAIIASHRESLMRIINPREYSATLPTLATSAWQSLLYLFVPPTVRARVQMCRALV